MALSKQRLGASVDGLVRGAQVKGSAALAVGGRRCRSGGRRHAAAQYVDEEEGGEKESTEAVSLTSIEQVSNAIENQLPFRACGVSFSFHKDEANEYWSVDTDDPDMQNYDVGYIKNFAFRDPGAAAAFLGKFPEFDGTTLNPERIGFRYMGIPPNSTTAGTPFDPKDFILDAATWQKWNGQLIPSFRVLEGSREMNFIAHVPINEYDNRFGCKFIGPDVPGGTTGRIWSPARIAMQFFTQYAKLFTKNAKVLLWDPKFV